jgi:hypothetical protein
VPGPLNHCLDEARRKLNCRQLADARRGESDGPVHGEELLDLADPVVLVQYGHETDLVRVARDVTGVCEMVGDRAGVQLLERDAIRLEEGVHARCGLTRHYSSLSESRVCLTDGA